MSAHSYPELIVAARESAHKSLNAHNTPTRSRLMPDEPIREDVERLLVEATDGPWKADIEHSEYIWGPNMEMIADIHDHAAEPHILRIRGAGAELPQKANITLAAAASDLARTVLRLMDEVAEARAQAIEECAVQIDQEARDAHDVECASGSFGYSGGQLDSLARSIRALIPDTEPPRFEKSPVTVAYFTGAGPRDSHTQTCYLPGYRQAHRDARTPWWSPHQSSMPLPFGGRGGGVALWPELYALHGEYNHFHRVVQAPQGCARTARKDGWTLLFLWNRSVDHRGNCSASFAFDAELTDEQSLAEARLKFPEVFTRIEKHLGRPVRLDTTTEKTDV